MKSHFSFLLLIGASLLIFSCDSNSDEDCLTVTPNENYALSGTAQMADFTPATKTYTVSNTCDSDVMLSVEEDVRWLDVDIPAFGGGGNEAGTLNADSSIEVTVEIRYGSDNPERLDQLAAGMYEADLEFIDESNNATIVRVVNLTVNSP
ncbi:MAG: hypothetical protein KTR29_09455 [Rhodothermaceae bacterium]|nr:hypothetical protein [Rhodothermaceae bacterium]